MNVEARPSQLLAGRHVVMAANPWASIRMDSPLACFPGADSALRLFGAHRAKTVQKHRVPTTQRAAVE